VRPRARGGRTALRLLRRGSARETPAAVAAHALGWRGPSALRRAAWLPAPLPAHSFPTAPFAPPALARPAGASWLAESRAARASGQAVCGEALKRGFASRATTFFPAIIG
jgi:hypothetical protein